MTDPIIVQKIVVRKIRQRRKLLKMNQQALADKVGVSRTSIVNIEKDVQNLSLANLVKIADALECDLSDLLPRIR